MNAAACAFTGHRPCKLPWKYDEADSRCVELKAALAEQISALIGAGFTQFLSGMAEGTDCYLRFIRLQKFWGFYRVTGQKYAVEAKSLFIFFGDGGGDISTNK